MELKIQVTFLNTQFGGSMVRSWKVSSMELPGVWKKDAFQPPLWKVHKVDVVEIVNGEEVKNPVTFKFQDDLLKHLS